MKKKFGRWESNFKPFSDFGESFIKDYNSESDEGYFLEIDVQYLKKLHNPHTTIYLFCLKQWK